VAPAGDRGSGVRRRGWSAAAAVIAAVTVVAGCGDDGAASTDGAGGKAVANASANGAGGGTASASGTASGTGTGTGTATASSAEGTSTGTSTGAGGSGSGSGGGGGEPNGEAFYPGGRTHSPISGLVVERMEQIRAAAPGAADDVFMKAGASSTVNGNTLYCFAGDSVELGAHAALEPTLQFFLGGGAGGTTPFDRDSLCAESGRTAAWAVNGAPSPLEEEVAEIVPSLALVHYGTNDMGAAGTFELGVVAFHENYSALTDALIAAGVVPVLFGITRRGDSVGANRWVATMNATIRGVAQRAQVPFVDLHHAIDPLAGHGLGGDGLHLEAYDGGACVLDQAGLEHGYNVRNLVALEALDRVRRAVVLGEPPPDVGAPGVAGSGAADDPFEVSALPFSHASDTRSGSSDAIDAYPACGSDSDESGPEVFYRLEVAQPTRVRAMVLDGEGVDIDVHLLGGATPEGCIARGHHRVEAALEPGTYFFALDTFSDQGIDFAGEFLFVIVACDEDDEECGAT